jgi:hypothetical protein
MHLRSPMTTLTLTLVLASCGGAPVKPAPPVERPEARTDAGGAAPAPTAYVDADSCPHPPSGQFEPRRMVAFETAVRDMFFANYKGDPASKK